MPKKPVLSGSRQLIGILLQAHLSQIIYVKDQPELASPETMSLAKIIVNQFLREIQSAQLLSVICCILWKDSAQKLKIL